jgi:hypothetical protein
MEVEVRGTPTVTVVTLPVVEVKELLVVVEAVVGLEVTVTVVVGCGPGCVGWITGADWVVGSGTGMGMGMGSGSGSGLGRGAGGRVVPPLPLPPPPPPAARA